MDRDVTGSLNRKSLLYVSSSLPVGTSDHSLTSCAFEGSGTCMIPRRVPDEIGRQAPSFLSPRSFGGRSL